MIDNIMGNENYVSMKRIAKDQIRWIARRQQQKDNACQKPASK